MRKAKVGGFAAFAEGGDLAAFLPRQARCFAEGKSSPDFAPENYEVDFEGRATAEDLTPLGRRQMGLDPW